jgi:alpha-D-ribose 1-methylphosphonate 5-phosphate C-P lyase
VIDQGADDTTNAVSIRRFFARTAGVATTEATAEATIIQTRHRIPETPLTEGQILVYQVPIPEPLRFLEPRETETRKMHALEEYGLMHVKLYEDIARHGQIATSYAYPVKVEGRYVMDPSPIPKFDNPKMSDNPAIQLFGAGREKRIYALPPYTEVVSLDFDDHPFDADPRRRMTATCAAHRQLSRRGDHRRPGGRMFVCSDTDFLRRAARAGHAGGWGEARSMTARAMIAAPTSRCCGARPDETLRRPHRLRRRVLRPLAPARCWGSSAKAARASPRCCPALPATCGPILAPHATARRAGPCRMTERRRCRAPTGPMSTRTRATGCAWASAPAAMSANG